MKKNKIIVAVFSLWLIASLFYIPKLQLVYDFESFFPKNNPDLDFYLDFREKFKPDDNFLFVAVANNSTVFEKSFLEKTDKLVTSLSQLQNVEEVYALTNFKFPLKTPFGWNSIKALHIEDATRYAADSSRIMNDTRTAGKFIDAEARSLNIVVKTVPLLTQQEGAVLNDAIFEQLKQSGIAAYHVAGRANVQTVFVRKNLQEMIFYTLLSGLLVLVVLWLIYRRIVPVLIAFGSVVLSLILFIGTLAIIGVKLNFMAQLFPILMLIVGMSDVIHLLERYQEELHLGKDAATAMKVALKEIGMALFLTSFTTAVGFLALITSDIVPIQQFGYKAALGVLVAWLVAILLTPIILLQFNPKHIAQGKYHLPILDVVTENIYHITKFQQGKVLVVLFVLLVFSFFGISKISTDAKLKTDIPQDEKIMEDFLFFETTYGGFRSFEAALLPQGDYKITDAKIISAIDKLQQYLATQKKISFVASPADIFYNINCGMNGNKPEYYQLPDEENFESVSREMKNIPERYSATLINKEQNLGRLTGKVNDIGSVSSYNLYNEIDNWVATNIDTNLLQIKFTGTGLLIDNNNGYLIRSLFNGLALAFAVISFVMMLLYRNLKMVVISLVPNIIPLILAGGIIGYTGMVLDAATSIIFTIAFGIAVDDTLHFLSRFKVEKSKGLSTDEALHQTLTITGKALILTTVVLFSGFMLLAFSDFSGTFRVGFLVSVTLVLALLLDLFLLPVLIRLFKI
jgi:predicted RND superfamily exporter protein